MLVFLSTLALAAAPEGYLDAASGSQIGGWARDPDYPHPIAVHIYIDGEIAHGMVADALRSDLPYADQEHGYTWVPPLQGAGKHEVVVYAIGVDASGTPDGQNMALTGSPKHIDEGCEGFGPPALIWCQGVPSYYEDRAEDTHYLFNDQLRVGINSSYGGAVLELYGADHSTNLVAEHGGGAVQLSVWGYEEKGGDAWFGMGQGVCDPTPYASEAECLAHNSACRIWCCDEGAHVADCSSVQSCVDWGAGAPFNPIQAQGRDCGWDSSSNDVDSVSASGDTVRTQKSDPWHFTQTDSFQGMTFYQTNTLEEAYVRLDYRITYSGPYTLSEHPQEIPAVFPGLGMNHSYWYYTGGSPYTGDAVSSSIGASDGPFLRIAGRDPYPHGDYDSTITEHWVSVCDASGAHCLTLATFSEAYKEIDCAGTPWDGYGYMTPLGGFRIEPGMDVRASAFLFPGRYDEVIAGKTVREWIVELARTELKEDPDQPKDSEPWFDSESPVDSRPEDPDDDDGGSGNDRQPRVPPGVSEDGCGCSSAPSGWSVAPLLVLFLLRRRDQHQDSRI
jgi:hypothetical protein